MVQAIGTLGLKYGKLKPTCHGKVVAQRDNLKVILCEECKYRHLYPRPTAAERNRYYGSDDAFYRDGGVAWFEKERREHAAGYWRAAYNYQLRLLEPPRPWQAERPWFVLDWGAGSGEFVNYVTDRRGWWATGIEPSARAREWAWENLAVGLKPGIEDVCPAHLPADASRVALVLEHLVDPVGFLRMVSQCTNGPILVIVPNEFNPLHRYEHNLLGHKYNGHHEQTSPSLGIVL